MDSFFKLIDRLFASIPEGIQRYIRFGLLGVWVLLAGLVAFLAFRSGQSSVPQKGEDLYLSNIKEKVYRDRRKRNPVDVILPDLNELFKRDTAPLSVFQPEEKPPQAQEQSPSAQPLPMQGPKDEVLFPEKGVRPELRSEPHATTDGQLPPLLPLEGH